MLVTDPGQFGRDQLFAVLARHHQRSAAYEHTLRLRLGQRQPEQE
ncbi:hypothetical protein [Dactylosporangium fulvum]